MEGLTMEGVGLRRAATCPSVMGTTSMPFRASWRHEWLNLNSDYTNDNSAEAFPSIPRGFEYNVVQTGSKGTAGSITVSFESDIFTNGEDVYDNSAGKEEEGYRVWNRAACWDVQMCDTTQTDTTRTSGKCHSYYSWSKSLDSTVDFHDSIVNSDKTQFIGQDGDSTNNIDISSVTDDTASMRTEYLTTTAAIVAANVGADAAMTTEELAAA